MKGELRRQVKQNGLVTGVQQASRWTVAHESQVKVTAATVAVVGLAIFGVTTYQGHRRTEADRLFSEAQETFHSPVKTEQPEGFEPPPGTLYATAAEQYRKAAGLFDEVDRKYASLDVGRRARYYAALCRVELGEYDAAEKPLTELAARREGGDAIEPSLARLALADLHRRRGQVDKAVEDYQRLSEDSSFVLPHDHLLLELPAPP